MFCSKCGKEIDNNATFCAFCGNPIATDAQAGAQAGAQAIPQPVPQPTDPMQSVPQQAAPQQSAPQYGAPQAPQYGAPQAPQYGAPQTPQYGAPASEFSLNLDDKTVDIINKILRGVLMVLSLLMFIGAIGSMASAGSILSGNVGAAALALMNLSSFVGLARVPAIIAFSLSVLGLAFTILTKQRSLFSYISAGIGLLMFIFNFVMYGGVLTFGSLSSYLGLTSGPNIGGIVVSGIFLIICALAMIAASLVIILKKEDIIKFRPKF